MRRELDWLLSAWACARTDFFFEALFLLGRDLLNSSAKRGGVALWEVVPDQEQVGKAAAGAVVVGGGVAATVAAAAVISAAATAAVAAAPVVLAGGAVVAAVSLADGTSGGGGVKVNSAGRPIHANGRFMKYSEARARGWSG